MNQNKQSARRSPSVNLTVHFTVPGYIYEGMKTMDNFTQGKWETSGVAIKDIRDPVFYHVDVICNETIRVAKSSGVGEELALANAKLIAAAPDLLEACRGLQQAIRKYGLLDIKKRFSLCTADAQVNTAIAKATQS